MHKTISIIKRINSTKCIKAIVFCTVFIHFIMVLFVVISRINYRYELEWMEGASLIQAYRIYTGHALYVQPSLEYIPMIYPPLYFYLGAALFKFSGISFLPLRIVSFASTLGCLIVIFSAVKDKTKSALIGLLAAGSFVATFMVGGAWFDIARVDMLFIFLCIAGVYFLGKQTTQTSIIAGILFSLAFLTKQTALSISTLMALSILLLFRKQTLPFVCSFAILTLMTYVYLNSSTKGWYQYYILFLPASHHIKWSFIPTAIEAGFKIVAVFLIIGFSPLLLGFRKVIQDKLHLYYYFASAGFIATSILARINDGAYNNTFLPAYAGLAIIFGMGIGWLATYLELQRINKNIILTILWLAIGLQFSRLFYNPIQQIPTQADRRVGDALVAELQSVPGNVFIPYHNYLSLFAGKKVYFHMMTLEEVRGRFSIKQAEVVDIAKQFNSTPFSLIITDLPDYLIQGRQCTDTQNINYESAATFYPVTGYHVRPTYRSSGCH
jgi:hypothetical protein